MVYNLDKRKLVLSLQRVKKDRKLNIDQIYEIVYNNNPEIAPSRSSVARVFAEGSENDASSFKFETTLKPIADALLDIDSDEQEDSSEELAKSLLKYKKDLIEDYVTQIRDLKEELRTIKEKERKRYDEKLEKETDQFHKSFNFVKEQIALKDHRIDQLLNSNDRLQSSTDKLMEINNKLILQLTECPLRKKEGD